MVSIRRKLISSTVILVLFSILLLAVPIVVMEVNSLEKDLEEIADARMLAAQESVSLFMERPSAMASMLADYLAAYDLDEAYTGLYLESMENSDEKVQLVYAADTTPYYDGGQVVFSTPQSLPADWDQTSRPWYTEAASARGVIFTEPYTDVITGGTVMTLARAARVDGSLVGVGAVDISINQLGGIVDDIQLTSDGQSFLLDYAGYYLTNSDKGKVLKDNFFKEYPEFASAKEKVSADKSIVDLLSSKKHYFAARKISNDTNWILVTIGSKNEIFKNLTHIIIMVISIVVVVIIISTIIVFIIATRIVNPIKVVDEAVNEIASGNADLTRRLKATSNDEVGELVEGFNKFIEKLQTIMQQIKNSKDTLGVV